MSAANDLFAMFAGAHRPVAQSDLADVIEPLPRKFFQLEPHEVDELAPRMEITIHAPDETYRRALSTAQSNITYANHRNHA